MPGRRQVVWFVMVTVSAVGFGVVQDEGPASVDSLHCNIMRVNRVDPNDDAFLGVGPTIFLVPVSEGEK